MTDKNKKTTTPSSTQPTFPITLKLATIRDDGGETENYRIFGGGGVIVVKNKRGEDVNKNVILGGNGTIYIAKELSAGHDEWVLMPRAVYDRLQKGGGKK